MKDREPTYPGRVKLKPVAGQADVYDMEMADQPLVAGDPPTKHNLLKDSTAALYGLGPEAVPDEVFQAITDVVGRYRIELHLTFEGQIESGVAIGGITTVDGGKIYTDENGVAVGYTFNASGSLTVPQIFVDIPEKTIAYDTSGKLYTVITYDAKSDSDITNAEFATSGNYRFSNHVTDMDFYLIGAGASGAVSCDTFKACSGGGGGYTTLLSAIQNHGKPFAAVIGAPGEAQVSDDVEPKYKNGQNGGETSLSTDGTVLGSAAGGKGGVLAEQNTGSSTKVIAVGGNGGSGGGGGYFIKQSCYVYDGGTDGGDGKNTSYGGKGQGTTTRAFNESDGTIFCAGGGAASFYENSDADNMTKNSEAGDDSGGPGKASHIYSSSSSSRSLRSEAGGFGGGGGGIAMQESSEYTVTATSVGGQGVILVRWRYAA